MLDGFFGSVQARIAGRLASPLDGKPGITHGQFHIGFAVLAGLGAFFHQPLGGVVQSGVTPRAELTAAGRMTAP